MRAIPLVLVLVASGACKKAEPRAITDPTPACKVTLTAEQQRAFDAGLASLKGNDDHVRASTAEPTITFYRSDNMFCTAKASRCAVADAFAGEGRGAIDDPSAAVRRILLDFRNRPQPGILYAAPDWYAQKVAEMTDDQFTMYVGDQIGCTGSAGYGFIEVRIGERAGVLPSNHLIVYVGRVLQELRRSDGISSAPPGAELVRPIVKRMAKGELTGAMWAHPPDQRERDEVTSCIDRGRYRKPAP